VPDPLLPAPPPDVPLFKYPPAPPPPPPDAPVVPSAPFPPE